MMNAPRGNGARAIVPDLRTLRAWLAQLEPSVAWRLAWLVGRDVDLAENLLAFNQATRRLTIADGSRRDAATRAALDDVLAALTEATEPLSLRSLERTVARAGHARSSIRAAVRMGVSSNAILTREGPRRATLHTAPPDATRRPESPA